MASFAKRLVELASGLVPRSRRDEWREAWLGEIEHRQDLDGAELLKRSLGAFTHALWVTGREWRTEIVVQDFKQAVKQWMSRPAFSLIVIATLTLGIGANTFVFSFIDGVLLHPFPYPDIDRLVSMGVSFPKLGEDERFIEAFSVSDFRTVETESRTLGRFLAFDMGNRDLGGTDEPQRLLTAAFWGDPFATLGMSPALGRSFTAEETERREPVAIVSHRVWQRHFGGDPGIVGRDIIVNGTPRTVVGIMPERLLLLDTDLWLPMWYPSGDDLGSRRVLSVLARLEDGVSLEQARSEAATMARVVEAANDAAHYEGLRLSATPFLDVWAGFVGPGAYVVLGAVGFVLLVACANIAGLLLARGTSRRGEMAVRSALGAGRARLLRQLLLEASVLSAVGGLLGLLLAHWALGVATRYLPEDLPLGAIDIGINGTVLAYAAGLSLLAALIFGIVPAIQGSRVDLRGNLASEGGRMTGEGGRFSFGFRRAFVALQIALSLVLLTGAGLLAKSFSNLSEVEAGVAVDEVLTMRLTLAWERYEGRMQTFFSSLVEEVRALSGITEAAVATQFPPIAFSEERLSFADREPPSESAVPVAYFTVASSGIFEALGQSIVRGRGLAETDTAASPRVAVVNESFASRYFPGREALGARFRLASEEEDDEAWTTIVGIAADAHNRGVYREPAPEIVASARQHGRWINQMFLVVRTQGEPLAALPSIREALRRLDPDQPVYAIHTLAERFATSVLMQRVAARMLAGLSVVASALAAMGLYGVVSFLVYARRREIGLRMALGADRAAIARGVILDSGKLVLVGLALGGLGALGLSRTLSRLLFEVSPRDPAVLASTALLLAAVALAASWLPVRRAMKLDPVQALRTE